MANWSNEQERSELVFENRNRAYGAYVLRKTYSRIVLVAGGIACLALLFTSTAIVLSGGKDEGPVKKEKITEVVLKEPPPVNKDAPPPPPPAPPPPPMVKMIQFTTPKITEEEVIPPRQDSLVGKVAEKSQDGDTTDVPIVYEPTVDKAVDVGPEPVFQFASQMPEMPGGEAAFYAYLQKNIKYPQFEKEANKVGTVFVQFTVEKDGSITDVKAVKEVAGAPGFTKEAVRVISQMPHWNPGQMNGRTVRVSMTQPVKFVLQ
jgi:protein TonB